MTNLLKPGDRIRNVKTFETGTVTTSSRCPGNATPILYDGDADIVWHTPTVKLEVIPDD